MPRTRIALPSLPARTLGIQATLWLTVLAGLLPAYATASGLERLLPANTKGFLAVTDSKDLAQRWKSTDVGKMLDDPAMRPFLDDFRGQFRSRLTALQDKLGMTLDDLSGVPGGELCIALVPLAPQKSAAALVIDVAGHQPQAAALLKSITAAKLKAGARLTQARRSGMDVLDLHATPRPVHHLLCDGRQPLGRH